MKAISILTVAALFFVSCVNKKSLIYSVTSHIDYQPYVKKGFFLTESNSVSFNYEPISSVLAYSRSGYEFIDKSTGKKVSDAHAAKEFHDNYVKKGAGKGFTATGKIVFVTPEEALEQLYNMAVELGANGIINLKIDQIQETVNAADGTPIRLPGYSASGMAIKR